MHWDKYLQRKEENTESEYGSTEGDTENAERNL